MLPKLFYSRQSSNFKSNLELGVLDTESQTSIEGIWRDNSESEILTAIQGICEFLEQDGAELERGPLFLNLEKLANKKFTIIPEFFLEKHQNYFFKSWNKSGYSSTDNSRLLFRLGTAHPNK